MERQQERIKFFCELQKRLADTWTKWAQNWVWSWLKATNLEQISRTEIWTVLLESEFSVYVQPS